MKRLTARTSVTLSGPRRLLGPASRPPVLPGRVTPDVSYVFDRQKQCLVNDLQPLSSRRDAGRRIVWHLGGGGRWFESSRPDQSHCRVISSGKSGDSVVRKDLLSP
jgi:hypothetical protein